MLEIMDRVPLGPKEGNKLIKEQTPESHEGGVVGSEKIIFFLE